MQFIDTSVTALGDSIRILCDMTLFPDIFRYRFDTGKLVNRLQLTLTSILIINGEQYLWTIVTEVDPLGWCSTVSILETCVGVLEADLQEQ